jgi:hypothetical protein
MMDEQPSAAELVQAVADYLRDDALPKLDGLVAFHARVAISVLGIVRRELETGPEARARELGALRDLLGRDGAVQDLKEALCSHIADGSMTLATPGLLPHLMNSAMDKLAVDQPAYSTYRRLLQQSRGTAGQ